MPLVYLVLLLFSPYAWTERGKEVLNDDKTLWPSPDRLPDAKPTLDFLEHPPAARKSLSEDGISAGLPQRKATHSGPVVIFCLAGGGSRAALYAAGLLNRMWWQTAPLDEDWQEILDLLPEADRARLDPLDANAAAPSQPLYPGRLLLQYADVISSVSGGSLASAYFIESLHRDIQTSQSETADAAAARYAALERFFAPDHLTSETARPPLRWYNEPVAPQSLRPFFADPTLAYCPDCIEKNERLQKLFEANPFINAMQQDHLAAVMSGLFRFREVGRGPGIERYWQQMYRWLRSSDSDTKEKNKAVRVSDFFAQERSGHLPVMILNATLTRTGTRLAITNLDAAEFQETYKFGPIVDGRDLGEGDIFSTQALRDSLRPENLFAPPRSQTLSDAAQRRFDPLPAQINTLNELDARWDIPLATAVHASANFPFGFPLMRFVRRTSDPHITHPKTAEIKFQGGRDLLEVADGGLIDNTGLDSALALIRANRDYLKTRGVLIFQIDSGELPRNPGKTAFDMLHHVTEARNAMWRVNINLQTGLQSEYLEELQKLGGGPITPIMGNTPGTQQYVLGFENETFAFYKVRLGETASQHVMTSWHLDAPQRALLYDEICAPQQGEAILRAAHWLARRTNSVSSAVVNAAVSPVTGNVI